MSKVYSIKFSEYSNRWYVHLRGYGQVSETYATEEEALKALKHISKQVIFA